jgi:hypothetical protein
VTFVSDSRRQRRNHDLIAAVQAGQLFRHRKCERYQSSSCCPELIDVRPRQRGELERARVAAEEKLRNLIGANEAGTGTAIAYQAIVRARRKFVTARRSSTR